MSPYHANACIKFPFITNIMIFYVEVTHSSIHNRGYKSGPNKVLLIHKVNAFINSSNTVCQASPKEIRKRRRCDKSS